MADKKKKKKKLWFIKPLVIIAIIGVVIAYASYSSGKAAEAMYVEAKVEYRDILTYHSFTGVVEPVTEKNAIAELNNIKISEILVEEGDVVKAGDPIVRLDPENIENNIETLETQMAATANSNNASVQQAWINYLNYKSDIDNGMIQSIVQAQQSIDAAITSYEHAQRDYVDAVNSHYNTQADAIRVAQANVDSAYLSVRQAQIALDTADHNRRTAGHDADGEKLDYAYENAERTLENAWVTYNNMVGALDSAKREDETYLNKYSDALTSAETAFLNAVDAKNIAVRGAEEQLQSLLLTYQRALTASDTSVNDLQLERYQEQLEDCVVTAPIDGVVTSIPVKEGDMTEIAKTLVTITSFDDMKIKIKINEYDLSCAGIGQEVNITLKAIGKEYTGQISQISRTATSQNGVSFFDSEVEFAADEDVRSGMSVEIKIPIHDVHHVLTIQQRAVQVREDGTAYVLVLGADGKTREERTVTCGVADGTFIEITSGLSEGETVFYIPKSLGESYDEMMTEFE